MGVFDAGNILFPLAHSSPTSSRRSTASAPRAGSSSASPATSSRSAIQLALRLPAADFWAGNQEAYETILDDLAIFVASLVAYLVGELTNPTCSRA